MPFTMEDNTYRIFALYQQFGEYARAYRAVDQLAIPSGVATMVIFDSVNFDPSGMWNPGQPTRLTLPSSGKYMIVGDIHFKADVAGSFRTMALVLNGVTDLVRQSGPNVGLPGSVGTSITFTDIEVLTAGDYLEMEVVHDAAPNTDIKGGRERTWMGLQRIP